jgi:hypothetical protein
MSELSTDELGHYVREVSRMTDERLLFMSNRAASQVISESVRMQSNAFALESSRETGWHSYKVSGAGARGAASGDASTIVENCYSRNSQVDDLSA